MGGHGFGGGTGLVQLNADWHSKPTVEGDNWMITQQVARYLLKIAGQVKSTPSNPAQSRTEANLREYAKSRYNLPRIDVFADDAAMVRAFDQRVAFLTWEAYDARVVQKQSWNDLLIDFHKLSRAYSQALLVSNFYAALQNLNISPPTRDVLCDLFRLFGFYTMDVEAREFQKSKAVSSEDLDQLGSKIIALMKRVRPHAVRLVDSFALPDYLLDSALGRFDGQVYEDLFYRAHRLNPLNRLTFNPDYKSDEIVMGSGDNNEILAKL
jgi:acyl-CoA oxidase